MFVRILSLLLLVSSAAAQEQNLAKNFQPLKSRGTLPAVFTQNIREVINKDITELEQKKDKDADVKTNFVTASNYQIEKIIRSGNALVNDELTTYVNKVADVILKDNPTLRAKVQIFTLKSPVVNAYSYDKGYIFINVGLLSQVETEAQLAYILCHEISHYVKQHSINGYVANDRIDRGSYDGNTEDKVVEKCQYSKESESEADLEGFKMFERTLYDLKQAEKGFTMLQYSHLPFELEEVKKTFFETPYYKLPAGYFLKDYTSIKDNSDEDDSRMTHPNTRKRRMAIAELVASRDNSKRVKSVVGQKQFEYARDLARMELCRLYLKHRDYPNAFYASYLLAVKYPENAYVAEVMAKSMYGISLYLNGDVRYNEDSYLPRGILKYTDVESYPQQVYYLIGKMNTHEWTVFSLNRVYRDHKRFPENTELALLSDSLFDMLGRTKWTISNFTRTTKKDTTPVALRSDTVLEVKSKTDIIATLQHGTVVRDEDTVYYKSAFADLFETDEIFARKFPYNIKKDVSISDFYVNGQRASGSDSEGSDAPEISLKPGQTVDTVLLLEPFYVRVNQKDKIAMKYMSSDEMQEKLLETLAAHSSSLNIHMVQMDPGVLKPEESSKMNDFSVINDWFDERFDSETKNRVILNTNEISNIIKKYGTRYVLKTGFANIVTVDGQKRTYFLGFLFDLQKNEIVYRKYEVFKGKDRNDLIQAKSYQMLYEFKNPPKEKKKR